MCMSQDVAGPTSVIVSAMMHCVARGLTNRAFCRQDMTGSGNEVDTDGCVSVEVSQLSGGALSAMPGNLLSMFDSVKYNSRDAKVSFAQATREQCGRRYGKG